MLKLTPIYFEIPGSGESIIGLTYSMINIRRNDIPSDSLKYQGILEW